LTEELVFDDKMKAISQRGAYDVMATSQNAVRSHQRGIAAVVVAVLLTMAVAGFAVATMELPRLQQQQRPESLLQWFGLAQGKLDEGRAPASGEHLEKTWGVRDGVIPKGDVSAHVKVALPNPLLSAAANARAMGKALHPLLDESGDEDDSDHSDDEAAPDWVREDYGETSERKVHRAQAAETAAFIEHQRAVAQERWAMAMGLEVAIHAPQLRMPLACRKTIPRSFVRVTCLESAPTCACAFMPTPGGTCPHLLSLTRTCP
jgi:hypothetical protein